MNMLNIAADFGEELLSSRIQYQNWGFLVFLFCFFILVHASSAGAKLMQSMTKGLLRNSNRESIFMEEVNNEVIIKFLLVFQTLVLIVIALFDYSFFSLDDVVPQQFELGGVLLKIMLALAVFLIYKYLSYKVAGSIFFDKESVKQWTDFSVSLICLSGFVLFLPVLISFYIEEVRMVCLAFYVIYFVLIYLLFFIKVFSLFFSGKSLFLYFILYLCAQEIIPLYLLYKVINYLLINS